MRLTTCKMKAKIVGNISTGTCETPGNPRICKSRNECPAIATSNVIVAAVVLVVTTIAVVVFVVVHVGNVDVAVAICDVSMLMLV